MKKKKGKRWGITDNAKKESKKVQSQVSKQADNIQQVQSIVQASKTSSTPFQSPLTLLSQYPPFSLSLHSSSPSPVTFSKNCGFHSVPWLSRTFFLDRCLSSSRALVASA